MQWCLTLKVADVQTVSLAEVVTQPIRPRSLCMILISHQLAGKSRLPGMGVVSGNRFLRQRGSKSAVEFGALVFKGWVEELGSFGFWTWRFVRQTLCNDDSKFANLLTHSTPYRPTHSPCIVHFACWNNRQQFFSVCRCSCCRIGLPSTIFV
jgi:hypothetical protein